MEGLDVDVDYAVSVLFVMCSDYFLLGKLVGIILLLTSRYLFILRTSIILTVCSDESLNGTAFNKTCAESL